MKSENTDTFDCRKPTAAPPFEVLYQKYKNAVYSYAYHLTRDRQEADDLFQESWLRIVRKMPEQVIIDSLRSWIFTIITNIYRDDLRRKKIRRLYLSRKTKNLQAEESFHPQQWISPQAADREITDLNRQIFSAVNRLPEKQRMVFILKELSGFKQKDIGDILKMPVGTVKSLMHRAVKRLQQELAASRSEFSRMRGQNEV